MRPRRPQGAGGFSALALFAWAALIAYVLFYRGLFPGWPGAAP